MTALVNSCSHPDFIANLCIKCGNYVDGVHDFGIAFHYIHKNLRLSESEVAQLRKKDIKQVLYEKKLKLVLDLDHTLLHSTHPPSMTSKEQYLLNRANLRESGIKGSLFKVDSVERLTKLRPFVHTFLKEANEMFEMYVYTMGCHVYASEMVKLLDPENNYFISRVISRDESTSNVVKDLDLVLGEKRTVIILDDKGVWPNCSENLILVNDYTFFASKHRSALSLSERKIDESESRGALATALRILRQIHHLFFDEELGEDLSGRDVRPLLKFVRNEVLKKCRIYFSSGVSEKYQKIAVHFGATRLTEFGPSVTHVVSDDIMSDRLPGQFKNTSFLSIRCG